ncbi:MAG: hypothetical protein LBC44_02980 [Mycoplasmataceae bacterium]|nr:hypothetical protein [Mycoplasmataceae bacterium]
MSSNLIKAGFKEFAKWAKLPFKFTAHTLRRTKASLMHEVGVGIEEIAMVLGNTPRTVMDYYIISSNKNKQASEIAIAVADGKIKTVGNMFLSSATKVLK